MGKYIRKTFTYDGLRHQVYGETLEDAIEKMVELKATLKRGEAVKGGNMTVDMWYREWKALYKDDSGITAKSLGAYDEKYVYLQPISRMKLKDVRDIHLQKILNTQAGMSYSHVTKLRNLMKQLFSRARKSRLIMWDPSEDLTLPGNSRKSHRAITNAERKAILAVAETHPSGLWILTTLYAGLRPGEAFALQWKDVDFENNELLITKALESGTGTVKPPKTAAGIRGCPHPQQTTHTPSQRGWRAFCASVPHQSRQLPKCQQHFSDVEVVQASLGHPHGRHHAPQPDHKKCGGRGFDSLLSAPYLLF